MSDLNARLESIHEILKTWEQAGQGEFAPKPSVMKAFRYVLDALLQICETLHPAAAAVEASKPESPAAKWRELAAKEIETMVSAQGCRSAELFECIIARHCPPQAVYLDASEAWIAQAKEAVNTLRAKISAYDGGSAACLPVLNALTKFIGYCVPLAPDVRELTSAVRSAQAEIKRLREHNRAVDKQLDEKNAEFEKLSESYQKYAAASKDVPLVAATERRANALEQIKRLEANTQIQRDAELRADAARVRQFIESTVPADGVKPQWMKRPSGPGKWVCFNGHNAEFAQTVIDLTEERIAAGAPFSTEMVYGPIPSIPKPAFELPEPGTLFKVRFGDGEELALVRWPSGQVRTEGGFPYTPQELERRAAVFSDVSASFNMGPVKGASE